MQRAVAQRSKREGMRRRKYIQMGMEGVWESDDGRSKAKRGVKMGEYRQGRDRIEIGETG